MKKNHPKKSFLHKLKKSEPRLSFHVNKHLPDNANKLNATQNSRLVKQQVFHSTTRKQSSLYTLFQEKKFQKGKNPQELLQSCQKLQTKFKLHDPKQIFGAGNHKLLSPSFIYLIKPINHLENQKVEFSPLGIDPKTASTDMIAYKPHNKNESAMIMMHWANDCLAANLPDKAVTLMHRALGLYEDHFGLYHPEVARALTCLGAVYNKIEKYETARLILHYAQAVNSPSTTETDEKINRSLHELQTQMVINPLFDFPHLYEDKAITQERGHDPEVGLEINEQLCLNAMHLNQWEQAKTIALQTLECRNYSATALYVLGRTFAALGDETKSIGYLKELIEQRGNNAARHINDYYEYITTGHYRILLGATYGVFARYQQALEELNTGVRILNYHSTSVGSYNEFSKDAASLMTEIETHPLALTAAEKTQVYLKDRFELFGDKLDINDYMQIGLGGGRRGRARLPSCFMGSEYLYANDSSRNEKEVLNPTLWSHLAKKDLPIQTNHFVSFEVGQEYINYLLSTPFANIFADYATTAKFIKRTLVNWLKTHKKSLGQLDTDSITNLSRACYSYFNDARYKYQSELTTLKDRFYVASLIFKLGLCYENQQDFTKVRECYKYALKIMTFDNYDDYLLSKKLHENLLKNPYTEKDLLFIAELLTNIARVDEFCICPSVHKAKNDVLVSMQIIKNIDLKLSYSGPTILAYFECANEKKRNKLFSKWTSEQPTHYQTFFLCLEKNTNQIYFYGVDGYGVEINGYFDEKGCIADKYDLQAIQKSILESHTNTKSLDISMATKIILMQLEHLPSHHFEYTERNIIVLQRIYKNINEHTSRVTLLDQLVAHYGVIPDQAHGKDTARMIFAHRLLFLGVAYGDAGNYEKAYEVLKAAHAYYTHCDDDQDEPNLEEGIKDFVKDLEYFLDEISMQIQGQSEKNLLPKRSCR